MSTVRLPNFISSVNFSSCVHSQVIRYYHYFRHNIRLAMEKLHKITFQFHQAVLNNPQLFGSTNERRVIVFWMINRKQKVKVEKQKLRSQFLGINFMARVHLYLFLPVLHSFTQLEAVCIPCAYTLSNKISFVSFVICALMPSHYAAIAFVHRHLTSSSCCISS